MTANGVPNLAPAVLPFKAKHRRPKDEADFGRALPRLGVADRRRLEAWLDTAHPGHDGGRRHTAPDAARMKHDRPGRSIPDIKSG